MQEYNSIKWTFLKWRLLREAQAVLKLTWEVLPVTSLANHCTIAGLDSQTALILEPQHTPINGNISVSPNFGDLFCFYGLVIIYIQVSWEKVRRKNLGLSFYTVSGGPWAVAQLSIQVTCLAGNTQKFLQVNLRQRLIFPGICTSLPEGSIYPSAKCSNHWGVHSKNTAPWALAQLPVFPQQLCHSGEGGRKKNKHPSLVKEDTVVQDLI